jgi:hypothetical protein
MATKDDTVVISPDGTVYHTGRGTEDILDHGNMYMTKPVIARYAKGFIERGDHLKGTVDKTDFILKPGLSKHVTSVKNAGEALAPAMVKAAPEGVANSDNIELLQLIRLHPEPSTQGQGYEFPNSTPTSQTEFVSFSKLAEGMSV